MNDAKIESTDGQPAQNETSRDELVRGLYKDILHREADRSGLEHYRQVSDVKQIEDAMLASPELSNLVLSGAYFDRRWAASPRVLVFAAYGNGNLGDAVQALSLQRLINEIAPTAEVWACTDMPAPFPFRHDRVLGRNQLRSSQIVNQFDLLIFGGGGLLANIHTPLNDMKWQEMVHAPVVIFAVGAQRIVLRASAELIRKACFVSGRDEESLTALRELRQDVAFVPDPVFSDVTYEQVSRSRSNADRKSGANPQSGKRLWILNRKVFAPGRQAFLKLYDRDRDTVCFFQPHLDYPIAADVSDARPIYNAQQLFELMDNVDLVISARYHGCIFAMLRNKSVVGINESKIGSLFHRFGARGAFYNSLSDLGDFDWQIAAPGMAFVRENRKLVREGMVQAMKHARTRQAAQ